MFCEKCGKQIPDDAMLCPYCGTPVKKEESQVTVDSEPQNMPFENQPEAVPKKERKHFNKKILAILIVILVAVAVAAGGVYYYSSTKNYRAAIEAVDAYDGHQYQEISDLLTSDEKTKIYDHVKELLAETEKDFLADKIDVEELEHRENELRKVTGPVDLDDEEITAAIDSHKTFLAGVDAEKNDNAEQAYTSYSKVKEGTQDYEEASKKASELASKLKQKYYDAAKSKFDAGDYASALVSINTAKEYQEDSDVTALADQIAAKKKEADDAAAAQAAAEKAAKEQAKQAALAQLKPSRDDINSVTFYLSPSRPTYNDTRCFMLPYLAVFDNGSTSLHIEYNYTGSDWVFFTRVIVAVDGENNYVDLSYFSKTQEVGYGTVYEVYDDSGSDSQLATLLKKVVNSKKTVVRFEGDDHYYDYTVPDKDKQSMSLVLAAGGY